MNRADAARLLTLAAAFDSRTIGATDVEAWALALNGLDTDRCRAAIVRHYQSETDRIMPAHVRRMARTTTDLTTDGYDRPLAVAAAPDGGGNVPDAELVLHAGCKAVHRAGEPCAVLAAPGGFAAAIAGAFRSVAEAIEAAPAATDLTQAAAAAVVDFEAERARQLAALAVRYPA